MTPLYDRLTELAGRNPLWLDMPGHHGRAPYPLDWWALDRTEHTVTGDLFEGEDIIQQAEELWAGRWGAEGCLFLTGGSTQGNHTALQLAAAPGDTVLVDRGSHRSLWNGMALLDLSPIYLERPWQEERQITGPVEPERVEELLAAHPECRAVFVTSPTYYGVISPVAELAEVCHRHGAVLVVDCAHGAHLPWVGLPTPSEQGADLTVVSAHKGLPVPGQAALLFYNGVSHEQVRLTGSVYGSSSPSYVMMAALDKAREQLDRDGGYRRLIATLLPEFTARLEKTTRFHRVVTDDPARLVISTEAAGMSGFALAQALEAQDIYPEMADLTHVVCILTGMDGEETFCRLLAGLQRADREILGDRRRRMVPPPPSLPRRVCSFRTAMFAECERVPLAECAGRVAAEQIAPYPPGIPVIAPGEQIEKKHLVYLDEIGYNGSVYVRVLR